MALSPDFRDILLAFEQANVEFIIVGAYALSAHGISRYTGDIDLWVNPTPENAARVWKALHAFKAPLSDMQESDFFNRKIVFQMGLPPYRIDVLMAVSGIEFTDAYPKRKLLPIADLQMPFLSLADLLTNKRAAGRDKDIVDAKLIDKKLRKAEAGE